MSLNSETIDRIVANVMSQLGASPSLPSASFSPAINTSAKPLIPTVRAPAPMSDSLGIAAPTIVNDRVITAATLESIAVGSVVQFAPKAIVTPAAQDTIKLRKLIISRTPVTITPASQTDSPAQTTTSPQQNLLIVVKNSKPVDQLASELNANWKREFVTCPDDAAKLAISEICRGSAQQVVIIAEQTHRAACLANRNEKIKAVAIRDAGDVRLIRNQIRANVWCVAGSGRTYFEFKNLFRELQATTK